MLERMLGRQSKQYLLYQLCQWLLYLAKFRRFCFANLRGHKATLRRWGIANLLVVVAFRGVLVQFSISCHWTLTLPLRIVDNGLILCAEM